MKNVSEYIDSGKDVWGAIKAYAAKDVQDVLWMQALPDARATVTIAVKYPTREQLSEDLEREARQ